MFKKLVVILLCAMPFSAFAQYKFGTVNTQEIFGLMPEKATAEQSLQEVAKKYEDEFVKMREEFNKKYKEFMEESDSLPENIKTRRMQEIQELQQRIQNFQELAQNDIEQQQQQLLAPIEKKLMDAIKSVGAEQKFTYIFDLASPMPVIIYAGDGSEDVTPAVKAKLGLK